MLTDFQRSLQKLLDKYPQYKAEKSLYDALSELLGKARKEDEDYECKTESIGSIVANNIPNLFEEKENTQAILTGFKEFDSRFGGLSKGEFTIIAGRPAMGKSLLMVNLALNMLQLDYSVAYFSFDLNKTHLLTRFLACKSDVESSKILQNKLSNIEKELVENAAVELSSKKLFICDTVVYKIEAMEEECRRLVKEQKVDVIFIDYLQMIDNLINIGSYYNRDREIGRISRKFKKLAMELNIAIICSSQLNRSVESRGGEKKPYLHDLRDSGNIEQDADKVIFMYRPDYYGLTHDYEGNETKNLVELIIAKNRNGCIGSINLLRTDKFTKFVDYEYYLDERTIEITKDRLSDFDFF
ncbi:MAG: DnaB-like helicase C-terminal domain-containing protein [Bacteroidetes bacterium]|nr:DnaB-like helicase C-terminal domain-containing protein [Bacteroidota bacterium]